jgi:GT2 family glycosyltransferase
MTVSDGAPAIFPDDVDVAIVSHNGRDTLPRVLECLQAARAPLDRVVLYDIGSTDDTVAWLAEAWPTVQVRRIDGNVGPNPARNRALREATRPALLLLDADAFLRPDAPGHLRAALNASARIGTVTPVVVHAGQPDRIQYAGVDLHFICEAVNPWVDRPLAERGARARDIGSAAGVALLIDVGIARAIGLWDERYFMGKDDGDFCYRLRLAGYRVLEVPQAIVLHGSRPRSTWMFRYQIRNRWYFMLKNYGARTLIVLLPALGVHEVLQFLLLLAKGHIGAWWAAFVDLVRWLPRIGAARREVQRTRAARDADLLVSAPLLVRADLVGGGVGAAVKRGYDAWLGAYWAVAKHLTS